MNKEQVMRELYFKEMMLTQSHLEKKFGQVVYVDSLLDQLEKKANIDGPINVAAYSLMIHIEGALRAYEGSNTAERVSSLVDRAKVHGPLQALKTLNGISARIRQVLSERGRYFEIECEGCGVPWYYDRNALCEYLKEDQTVSCLVCSHNIKLNI